MLTASRTQQVVTALGLMTNSTEIGPAQSLELLTRRAGGSDVVKVLDFGIV